MWSRRIVLLWAQINILTTADYSLEIKVKFALGINGSRLIYHVEIGMCALWLPSTETPFTLLQDAVPSAWTWSCHCEVEKLHNVAFNGIWSDVTEFNSNSHKHLTEHPVCALHAFGLCGPRLTLDDASQMLRSNWTVWVIAGIISSDLTRGQNSHISRQFGFLCVPIIN